MRIQTCTPTLTTRGGRPRPTVKTPYSRVNLMKKLDPDLQEIVKNCPALDIIFDHDKPRSSTHNRGRGRDKEYVARPPNAFMVYRSYVWYTKQLEDKDEKNLSCVSRQAGQSWRILSEQARTPFKQVADIAKREHAQRNPDYKYAPSSRPPKSQRKADRLASRAKGKVKVKRNATPLAGGFDASSPSKQVSPTLTAAPADTLLASSESSPSPPPSSSSPSTPPTPSLRLWSPELRPSSPELEYPSDCDFPGIPPRPRFRPTMSGLIPSPSMSVLQLNGDEEPSILDEFPDKYAEAESYHDLHPHALLFNEDIPFDGADHNTQISLSARTAESIDYSSFISGNPEVKLGSPPLGTCLSDPPSSIGGYFSPGPSLSAVIDDDFYSPLSSALNWSVFDMPTLGSDHALDDTGVFGPNDGEIFDALITCGGY